MRLPIEVHNKLIPFKGFSWVTWLLWSFTRKPMAWSMDETEAYNHEDDPDYLKRRIPFWGWISCIPNRKVKHKKTNL